MGYFSDDDSVDDIDLVDGDEGATTQNAEGNGNASSAQVTAPGAAPAPWPAGSSGPSAATPLSFVTALNKVTANDVASADFAQMLPWQNPAQLDWSGQFAGGVGNPYNGAPAPIGLPGLSGSDNTPNSSSAAGTAPPALDGPVGAAQSVAADDGQTNLQKVQAAVVGSRTQGDAAAYLQSTISAFLRQEGLAPPSGWPPGSSGVSGGNGVGYGNSGGPNLLDPSMLSDGVYYPGSGNDPSVINTWSSQYHPDFGWDNVHGRAIDSMLGSTLSPDQIGLVVSANAAVDDKQYQTGEFSWLHGMNGVDGNGAPIPLADKNGNALSFEQLASDWIKFNKDQAQSILDNGGDPAEALMNYGFASHTLQDTTSPSHDYMDDNGDHKFNDWTSDVPWYKAPSNWLSELQHVYGEATYPGDDSQLAQATSDLFDKFFNGAPMPGGNVVDQWGVDSKQRPMPFQVPPPVPTLPQGPATRPVPLQTSLAQPPFSQPLIEI